MFQMYIATYCRFSLYTCLHCFHQTCLLNFVIHMICFNPPEYNHTCFIIGTP